MLKLLFPAAMIAGEFVHEDDRRAAPGFLIVQPYAVIGGSESHSQLRFQLLGFMLDVHARWIPGGA